MSLRTALSVTVFAAVGVTSGLVGLLGALAIRRDVAKTAQERVNHDLDSFESLYSSGLEQMARRVEEATARVSVADADIEVELSALKDTLGLMVLNACDTDGRPLAGGYPAGTARMPVESDPVLRRALTGEPAYGTVVLDAARLEAEGGPALRNAMAVVGTGDGAVQPLQKALFWWVACPVSDSSGRVQALVYGGHGLNSDFALVDRLRDVLFGRGLYDGKPLGTVTIFLDGTRIATNVLQETRRRALGTVVSDEVRDTVIEQGEEWHDRAWVVEAWYLSAYKALLNPDGEAVGMLYVGLLEKPFADSLRRLTVELVAITVLGAALAMAAMVALVRRITQPLSELSKATALVAEGQLEEPEEIRCRYTEVKRLAQSFHEMHEAIRRRDQGLRDQNDKLVQANERLDMANKNYMSSLRFVTHELKSPLAAMQSLIDVVVGGYLGEIPDKAHEQLVRVKRNCEELQDMVKNYLDLARAERGELRASKSDLDFRAAVVDPCLEQVRPLFESRDMRIELDCPTALHVKVDEELMRIALANYLNNAAKYGQEGALVRVEVEQDDDHRVVASVWNEGMGFTPEEAEMLFEKFSRLKNETTVGKRGSGLGLFLAKQIMELHEGRVWAESQPGRWARFCLSFPAMTSTDIEGRD